ncbi:MAG: type III pantothenate kinase [Myxococcota bacterium]
MKNIPQVVVFDIGNTYSKVGFFDSSGEILARERIKLPTTLATDQKNNDNNINHQVKQKLAGLLSEYRDKLPAIYILGGVSSVNVKIIRGQLAALSKEKNYADCFRPLHSDLANKLNRIFLIELGINSPWGLELDITSKSTLGLDRIANVVAAAHEWPDNNVVVVDAGTAVTVDLLVSGKVFVGGTISPGLNMMSHALAEYTANLPLVHPQDYQDIHIGKSTREAVGSGLLHGFIGMVDRLTERMAATCKTGAVGITTGGDGDLLLKYSKYYTVYRPDLTLRGYYLTGIKVFSSLN